MEKSTQLCRGIFYAKKYGLEGVNNSWEKNKMKMEKDKNNDEKEKNNFYFIFVGVKMNNI